MGKNFEMIEPVLIQFGDCKWVHPEINNILDWEIDGINKGKWAYDKLTRVYLKNNKGQMAYLVILSEDLENNKIHKKELLMQLEVILFEDVWFPGNNQFCFTEFGKNLSEAFCHSNPAITFISPDVGIQDDNGSYSWSS